MSGLPKYYLVEASAMPEVFIKVIEAKQSLETGRASTISEAVKLCGISRSAYYKYKDLIQPFFSKASVEMLTFHIILVDLPGVLSKLLGIFAESGANILTINQTIPINGVAAVTISADVSGMESDISIVSENAKKIYGVTKFEIIAG